MIELNNKEMHVLVITEMYPSEIVPNGGIFVCRQVQALIEQGVKVGVLCPTSFSLRPENILKKIKIWFQGQHINWSGDVPEIRTPVLFLPMRKKTSGASWIKKALKSFDAYVEKFGLPDVVHAHCSSRAGMAAAIISHRREIPYIITEHLSNFPRQNLSEWQKKNIVSAFENASALVAVSSFLGSFMAPFAKGKIIEIIPNIVDTAFFVPSVRPHADDRGFHVICVANLIPGKCIDMLIKSFQLAFGERRDCELHIIGEGPERQSLERLARSPAYKCPIRFHGLQAPDKVRDKIQMSDVMVSCSNVETFGVTIIEAMACGKPVIATKSGGPNEIIRENETGYLIDIDDTQALKEKLLKICREKKMWQEKTNLIREYAINKYDAKHIADKLIKLYNKVSS